MNPAILTALERQKITAYLKADGEKDLHVRQLVFLARRRLPQVRSDLELLKKFLETYERSKAGK